jgi:hypothetical protein
MYSAQLEMIVPYCKPLLKGDAVMLKKLHAGKQSTGILFIVQPLANLCDYNIKINPVYTDWL